MKNQIVYVGFDYDFNHDIDNETGEWENLNLIINLINENRFFYFNIKRKGKWLTLIMDVEIDADGNKTVTCDSKFLEEVTDKPRWGELTDDEINQLFRNPNFKPVPRLLRRMQELNMQLPDEYNHRKW
jgi:hypothetical protein